MKLHTVFVTHNRLELTKQAIRSYLETVTVPYTYIVVDNASDDGTWAWLTDEDHPRHLIPENRFPGFACNRGWERAPADADFLHRADNDFLFLPGWCDEVAERFAENPKLGQLGLRTGEEEVWCSTNVGGNNIIRRALWNRGLRYDERPWPKFPPAHSEDSFFSPRVEKMGWQWGRVTRHIIQDLAEPHWEDDYYRQSFQNRNMGHRLRYKDAP